ncbi:IclR family transcriptional regulator [Halostagnicola sp. A-GB9-2]|uniref:IclR family transcriptional regulator n=1 Tax=Halostagnicola sp. A-GB9-2 TaxID=3048066 RepID=UPI0024C0C2F4|nr:IclR family transcriptional regulator [Halostagnicola sp. A-GB9-2]MDJ1433823.1 IclR family transcriptional regulator [Halostagnicola sp. A-GB9-2]
MGNTTPPKTIKAVEHTCTILNELRMTDGLTVTELSERVGLTPGGVHNHLTTLKQQNMVQQDGTTYRLGPDFLLYGAHIRNNSGMLQAGKGVTDTLAHETDEIANLLLEHDGKLFVLHERFGENAIGRSFHIQKRAEATKHLHCTAGGKAILAHLPQSRLETILENQGLVQFTPNTITDPDKLRSELEVIREQGFALNREEEMNGIRAVGAPVLDVDNGVVGAVSLTGPASRLKDDVFEQEYPEGLVQAANMIEINLQTGDEEL